MYMFKTSEKYCKLLSKYCHCKYWTSSNLKLLANLQNFESLDIFIVVWQVFHTSFFSQLAINHILYKGVSSGFLYVILYKGNSFSKMSF